MRWLCELPCKVTGMLASEQFAEKPENQGEREKERNKRDPVEDRCWTKAKHG